MEMGSLAQFSSPFKQEMTEINQKKISKIPEYAREYKREWQFIRGINKKFEYFIVNIKLATKGLFESHKVDTVKKYIKIFLREQEKGKLKDISNFEIDYNDVDNLLKIEKEFNNFNQYINFCKDCYHEDEQAFIDPYPGFKNIYDDFKLFFNKLKIKKIYIYYIDSDFDSDIYYIDSDFDSDSDSD